MIFEYIKRKYTAFMKSEWKWPRIGTVFIYIFMIFGSGLSFFDCAYPA